MTSAVVERARGTLLGLAVGDAVGAPVEFDAPGAIAGMRDELFDMPGGGSFGWAPGEFTDDTQMALVLARHLLGRRGELDQEALASEFAEWARDAADVGNQTRTVLAAVSRGAGWRDAIAQLPDDASGNGSLMRVAPAALPAGSRARAAELGRRQSEVTHPSEPCRDACAVFASTLWDTLAGQRPSLDDLAERASTEAVRSAIARASDHAPPEMSGWVLHTLAGALWAVYGSEDFEEAVWRAVSLGEDADTVGAIAGALAGAQWGERGIPAALSERLQSRHPLFTDEYPEALLQLADGLVECRTTDGAR